MYKFTYLIKIGKRLVIILDAYNLQQMRLMPTLRPLFNSIIYNYQTVVEK